MFSGYLIEFSTSMLNMLTVYPIIKAILASIGLSASSHQDTVEVVNLVLEYTALPQIQSALLADTQGRVELYDAAAGAGDPAALTGDAQAPLINSHQISRVVKHLGVDHYSLPAIIVGNDQDALRETNLGSSNAGAVGVTHTLQQVVTEDLQRSVKVLHFHCLLKQGGMVVS